MICALCEKEMRRVVADYALGGAIVRNAVHYVCDNCETVTAEDKERLRSRYKYCWDTGQKEIEY